MQHRYIYTYSYYAIFIYISHRETQLSKRVGEWTRKLEPVLKLQEESSTFDIHAYADNLLLKFTKPYTNRSNSASADLKNKNNSSTETDLDIKNENNNNIDAEGGVTELDLEFVAKGMSAAEVSRMFLACLQLANSGNIEIFSKNRHQQDSSNGTISNSNTHMIHNKPTTTSKIMNYKKVVDELDNISIHVLKDHRECKVSGKNKLFE